MSKYLGIIIAMLTIVAAVIACGGTHYFLDLPSLLMVSIITPGLMIFKFGPQSLKLWKLEEDVRVEVAQWSGKVCLHVGVFSSLIGFIAMGNGLKSVENFGPALSVSLLTIFYSYIIYLFYFAPFATRDQVLVRSK